MIDGLAYIGVFAGGTPTHGLTVAPFESDELVLICRQVSPLAERIEVDFRSCLEYPFVGLNRGSSLLELFGHPAQDAGLRFRLRVQVLSFGAMCKMVGAGLGIGVLPRAACKPLLSEYGLAALRLTVGSSLGKLASAVVGTSGRLATRILSVTARARFLPDWMCGMYGGGVPEVRSTCPPSRSCSAGPVPL